MEIEMIRVRSSDELVRRTMPSIRQLVESLRTVENTLDISLLQHAQYGGDIAICIWRNLNKPAEKSREGLMIAERLQEIGALSHVVWISDDQVK